MSARIRRNAKTLDFLLNGDKNVTKHIIKNAHSDLVCCISEVCHNLLRGNIPLTSTEKAKLNKYKTQIRNIAGKKTTQQTKKRLIQKGGFLKALLAPLISLVGPLVKGIFGQ